MTVYVALGIGAGLVSAFLFTAAGAGSLLGVMLMYLAPLPILIVALGWHHLLGVLALSVGALAVSFLFRSSTGIAFAIGPGLSAWFPAYLALLARPVPSGDGRLEGRRWLSVGDLLFWLAVTGAVIAFAAIAATTGGDLERYRQALERAATELLNRPAGRGGAPQPMPLPAQEFAAMMVWLAPAVLGSALTLMVSVNLWLAARIVAVSGRLNRPWPDLTSTRMPLAAALVLVGALVFTQGSGLASFGAMAIVGAFVVAFAFQGLAVIHFVTRGRAARPIMLAGLYFLTALLSYVLLPAFALLGLVDSLVGLRRRSSGPPPPPLT
jgi:hypothetical protein